MVFALLLSLGVTTVAPVAVPPAMGSAEASLVMPQPPGDSLRDSLRATRSTAPIRQLAQVVASDTGLLMDVSAVRHLPNGGVIVNDSKRRQLVVFDSALRTGRVISDTTSNSPNPYGVRGTGGSLIPYVGDSTLFVDFDSQAFLVIDAEGNFARVMAPVRASDLFYIGDATNGRAVFDPQGRLLYRGVRRLRMGQPPTFNPADPRKILAQPDSAPILRMDFDKRTVDTVVMIKTPVQKQIQVTGSNFILWMQMINPLPSSDEWTQLPDGTIAIVRGQDYHVDWLSTDGKLTSSPRMPFDWRRITREQKLAMVDSVKRMENERLAKLPPPPPAAPGSFQIPRQRNEPVDPEDLPDYYPPVRQGQVRADPHGRLWILPSTSRDAKAGLLYDVVDRGGQVVERVQLPEGRTLVGFGPAGTLYLNHVHSPERASLERAIVER